MTGQYDGILGRRDESDSYQTDWSKKNHDGFRASDDESGSIKKDLEEYKSDLDSLSDSEKERFKFETWLIKRWRNGYGGFLHFTTVTGLKYKVELKGEWSPIDERLPDGSMNTRILIHRETPDHENDPFTITRHNFRKMFEDSLNYSENEKYIVSNYNEFFSGSYFVPILKKYHEEMRVIPHGLSTNDVKFDDFWLDYFQRYLLHFHKEANPKQNIYKKSEKNLVINGTFCNSQTMLRPLLEIIRYPAGSTALPNGKTIIHWKNKRIKLDSRYPYNYRYAGLILGNLYKINDEEINDEYNKIIFDIFSDSLVILINAGLINQQNLQLSSVGADLLGRPEHVIMSELEKIGKFPYEKEETLEEMNDEPLEEMNDEPLSHDALQRKEKIPEITKKLLIDEGKIEEILVNLVAGKNILLTGAVGTGKTELARMIPEMFWNYYTEVHTATADWTTHDVIGGITPKMNNDKVHYDIENGCVTQSVLENWKDESCKQRVSIKKESNLDHKVKEFKGVWLCIDEFNRADIDKAFGQIFTSVESGLIRIPTNRPGEKDKIIKIPKDFRIIGTLNTADKFHLFNLSDALKRRFAIINIEAPGSALESFEKKKALQRAEEDLDRKSSYNWESSKWFTLRLNQAIRILNFIRFEKPLGTAILKSIYQSMLVSREISQNNFGLDNALTNNLSAQLETVDRTFLDVLEVLLTPKKSIAEFFKKIENSNNDRQNYRKEFENYLRWTGMNEIEKRLKEFDEGKSFEDEEFKNEFNAWGFENDKTTGNLNLEKFVRSIQEMKKSML